MRSSATSPFRVTLRVLGVLLALAGWWLSIDLLRITGGAAATNPLLAQQCGAAAPGQPVSDCLSVLRSEFAYPSAMANLNKPPGAAPLPAAESGNRGSPWAALGAAYFAFVAIWFAFVGPPTRSRWGWHLVIAAVVAFGLWTSVDLTRVMAVDLKRYCVGCLATHAVNALLGLVTLFSFPWTRDRAISIRTVGGVDTQTGVGIPRGTVGAPPPERVAVLPRHPTHAVALCALLAGGLAFWLHLSITAALLLNANLKGLNDAYQAVTNDPNFAAWQWSQQPVVEIPPRPDQLWLGDANAPNTLVVFADLQCPMCRSAFRLITEEILPKHPGRLRVAFRHFPLDQACNPASVTTLHPAACRAALAIEAARQVGGPEAYQKMRATLYENQNRLDLGDFSEFVRGAGLDVAKFNAAVQSAAGRDVIAADIALAQQLKVNSVPVLFLNGRRFDHWRDARDWEKVLGP